MIGGTAHEVSCPGAAARCSGQQFRDARGDWDASMSATVELSRRGKIRVILNVPGGRISEEMRHVVGEDKVAKERVRPLPGHPGIIYVVAIRAVLSLAASRAGKIKEER